ncbi:potassium transporter Kup [Candidatus Nitrosoglobus terrae]|uniref:Probable potassium transport system protein Kup n=1 Tax=Candidatus Nitrosoglobus terrae TaxID=1630141 RepID=A0A1Q2SPD9_9GAMM|nr:KUP/HAK/KT family potassium transporter [Candidatus Nitrosoglobus terrae]BAW81025.1 potassium transporter Kup [Candidatus Nitrosoglobus terrae]
MKTDRPNQTTSFAVDSRVEDQVPLHTLWLGAIGVVFGDLGTSPLYTLQEIFSPAYSLGVTRATVLGVLSLVFWAQVLVICIKYITLVMRADNEGEGGIMELLALAGRAVGSTSRWRTAITLLSIFGVALFYGDSVITPAISVLSAVEGIQMVDATLKSWVLPISMAILLLLFTLQKFGTERIGALFGPIMCIWFITIATLGAVQIIRVPEILLALNPLYAVRFFAAHGAAAFVALGGVVLALTGTEALYADMGHFGRRPIRMAWLTFVFPALLINYFGQGALLLQEPSAGGNPFYRLVPHALLAPTIILAAMATVIASQAVISGTYSMTRSALRLGYLPTMRVVHTSDRIAGQVFVPWINGALLVLVIAAVLGFRSSENLGAAYGIAVTGTMTATTLLLLVVALHLWRWKWPAVITIGTLLLLIDGAFFSANLLKIDHGGWFSLVLGLLIFVVMTTWHRGHTMLLEQTQNTTPELASFIAQVTARPLRRQPGTAVFLATNTVTIPPALWLVYEHFYALHEHNLIVHVETLEVPYVDIQKQVQWHDLGAGFAAVTLRFGFRQVPNMPAALAQCTALSLSGFDTTDITFFLWVELVLGKRYFGMMLWRERLFAFLIRNTPPVAEYFHIPSRQVIALGQLLEI